MKVILNKKNGNSMTAPGSSSDNVPFCHSLYHEEIFHQVLITERKRAERANRTFILMLIDVKDAFTDVEKPAAIGKVIDLISSLTRDTDIKGWFKQEAIPGIIFTEIKGSHKNLLRKKIDRKLQGVLGNEKADEINISLYVFPEEDEGQDGDRQEGSTDMTLYTDLSQKRVTKKTSLFVKRMIDVLGSLFGIIFFSPFFLIIPLCIKFTSKGPVFFRQERVGQDGKRFTFLKFRSMYVNCDASIHREYIKKLICEQSSYKNGNGNGNGDGNGNGNGKDQSNNHKDEKNIYKICDDPRVTPLGRFLRKTSIDELPQFFNVLRGDMSIVGPRPPIPYEVEKYDVWHRRRIYEVKPGITGLWQVKGRSSTTFDEMVRLDLQYSREWSIWLDLKIIFATPSAVLSGRGSY